MKNQAYVVLARKYRPQDFDEVLGQPAVSVTLKNAIATGRVHHAYLFTGPRGVGKTTMARILAKALNCAQGPTPSPCGACAPCREIAASSCLDVLEMDAASHTGVDDVRQVIIETVGLAPSRDRYKVFIIDEAHMLSSSAFNALLKTMEEPPPRVVFVLATTESAKIPATIASRCQRFRFRPVPVELLVEHLGRLAKKEKIAIDAGALELLARSAEGSLRDAVSLLDQCHASAEGEIREAAAREMFGFVPAELLLQVAAALLARDARSLGGGLKTIYEEGVEPAQLLRDLRARLEEVYLAKLGVLAQGAKTCALEPAADAAWAKAAAPASAEAVAFLLRRLNKTLEELRFADSPRLTLELGLFGCLEAAADLGAWAMRLEALERRLAVGAAADSLPPAGAKNESRQSPQALAKGNDAAVPPSGTAEAWTRAISLIRAEREALAEILANARVVPISDSAWKVVLGSSFHLTAAAKAKELVEAKLATAAGRSIRLSFEQGAVPSVAAEAVATAVETGLEPAGEWSEGETPRPEPPPALKKAQAILGGKVKVVKKAP